MTRDERKAELANISDRLFCMMDDMRGYRDRLEEIGCKRESEQLDSIMGRVLNLSDKIARK